MGDEYFVETMEQSLEPSLEASLEMHDPTQIAARINDAIPTNASTLLALLEGAGFEAFFVGGFIRDAILGRPATDVDIATNATWQEVQAVCHAAELHTYETGTKHGTLTVGFPLSTTSSNAGDQSMFLSSEIYPVEGNNYDAPARSEHENANDPAAPFTSQHKETFEVTTYRTEGAYSDSRHPDSVEFISSIEEDLARRDFTMNAIAFNPRRGIVDPFDGIKDIQNNTIRLVGDSRRFAEDGLRILRAARFASQLGFSIEPYTYNAMLTSKSALRKVSVERITHELDRLLLGDHVCEALLNTIDVVSFVLPELVAMKDFEQRTKYHIFDVLEHTARVVEHSPRTRLARWTALCHDMGKPAAAFFDEEGVEHFYGHAAVSVQIARGMLKRLCMASVFIDDVCTLVRVHDDVVAPEKRAVKRMLRRLDGRVDLFRILCGIKRADAAAQAPLCAPRMELADDLLLTLEKVLTANEAFSIRDLTVKGNDLIALGVPQGPQIGAILSELLECVIAEKIPNEREALIAKVQEMQRDQ